MTGLHPSEPIFYDDGFAITAAEPWVKTKVNIVKEYLSAFADSLAGKVDDIIYVDLYAGNGLYSLGANKELFPGCALMALGLDVPITKFVFCEKEAEQFKILKIRVNRYFRNKNVVLLEGKPQELTDRLSMYVPQNKGDYKSAVLCVCDPFSLDISFETIEKLSDLGFSFIFPFTFALNDRITYRYYLKEGREKVKKFLGGHADIGLLEKGLDSNIHFYKRLVRIYENNMLSLGLNGSHSVHKLDSGLMEMPAYYISLFSKQFSAGSIQRDAEASKNAQFELF
jgi:three-Cys-motif partner protein